MSLLRDFNYSLRLFAKKPVFTGLAILTIALGLATIIVVATISYVIALKPVKVNDSDELMILSLEDDVGYQWWPRFDAYTYNYMRNSSRSLDIIGASSTAGTVIALNGVSTYVQSTLITPTLLEHTGVKPLHGRLFASSGSGIDSETEVLISYSTWENIFSRDADVIGSNMDVGEVIYSVIGVLPESFQFPLFADIWLPLRLTESVQPGEFSNLRPVVATLRDNVEIDTVNEELGQLWLELAEQFPDYYSNEFRVVGLPGLFLVEHPFGGSSGWTW